MNITNWFNCKVQPKENSMPKYFVLDSDYFPKWKYNIEIKDYHLLGNIKIKKDFDQILMIGIHKDLYNDGMLVISNHNKYNVSILKSNLQKCIRRSKVKKSIKTANYLLNLDPNELLRRLAIIYIEDVILYKYFTNIVWYMAAVSKDYLLSAQDKLIILNIVKHLASYQIKENINSNVNLNYSEYFSNINSKIYKNNFHSIWSLVLRQKYGGMKGDMNLIKGCLKLYSNKDITVNQIDIFQPLECKLKFTNKDILLEAIDFHCSKIIEFLIKKNKLDYNEYYQEYKKCIWYNRSCITNKKIINETDIDCLIDNRFELYEMIKLDLNFYSKKLIANLEFADN